MEQYLQRVFFENNGRNKTFIYPKSYGELAKIEDHKKNDKV
jgi:hypothetical protein